MAKSYEKNLGELESKKIDEFRQKEIMSKLEECEKKVKNKETENFTFLAVDSKGNLFSNRDGVRYVLSNQDILANGKGTDLFYRSKLIGREYTVAYKSVDFEKKIVYLSAKNAYADMRHELLADIKVAMKTRQSMIMAAKIRNFDDVRDYALVDLYGCGVMAIIPKSEWSKHYTKEFGNDGLKVGDVIECSLMYKIKKLDEFNGRIAYVCSRSKAQSNPYAGIEDRFHPKDIIVIRPTQLMAHNFFAKVDGEDDVEVYCSYPGDKYFGDKAKNIPIRLGHYYAAYVTEVSEKDRRFRAKVYTETTVLGKNAVDVTKEQIRRSIAETLVSPDEVEIASGEEVPEASSFDGI